MSDMYVHHISPFLIQFTENFGIRWYGLAYLTGFFLAYLTVYLMAKKKVILLNEEQASDFITYMAIGTLVGGRLGYCIFYGPHLFWTISSDFPYWGLLEVQKGGMASHGGIIGVVVACWLYARKLKVPTWHIIDLTTFGGSLGIFFGRIANFINGELYGRPADASVSWAMKFPQEIYLWGAGDRPKLEKLADAVQALGQVKTSTGQMISASKEQWLSWVSSFDWNSQAYINEFKEALVKATQHSQMAVVNALGPALTPRYPSQLVQAVLEGLLVFIILAILWKKPRKPGFISAMFGVLYCIARIIGEEYRMPDAQIGFQWLGLTRGQWLSVALLAASFAYLFIVMKAKTKPLGGWGNKKGA